MPIEIQLEDFASEKPVNKLHKETESKRDKKLLGKIQLSMDTITENTQGYSQPDYNQFLNMDNHQQPNYATLTSQSHKQPISGK